MKKKLIIIFFFLCSFLVYSIITEGVLRIFYSKNFNSPPWQSDKRYEIDENLIYRLTPSSVTFTTEKEFTEIVTTNSYGVRKQEDTSPIKNSQTYRILLIGDSFTFGQGLKDNETIASRMETILNNSSGKFQFEVINGGIPGYSLDQTYRSLINHIERLHPDLILWNLIPGNMDDSIHLGLSYRASLYNLLPNNNLEPLNAKHNRLYIQNYLFLKTPRWIRNSYLFDALNMVLSKTSFFSGIPKKNEQELREWITDKFIVESVTIKNMCLQYNCKLVVSWLPSKWDSPESNSIPFPVDKLHDQQIETINVKEIIGINQNNYFAVDGHPNATGAAEIANVFSQFAIITSADKL